MFDGKRKEEKGGGGARPVGGVDNERSETDEPEQSGGGKGEQIKDEKEFNFERMTCIIFLIFKSI